MLQNSNVFIFVPMLRVTVPHFQEAGKWITYEAPESSEMDIREHIINKYPPDIQMQCRIDTIKTVTVASLPMAEIPKPKPKTKVRLELEAKAKELAILGIDLYSDEKLKERIELKQSKLPSQETAPKKRGRPKTIKNG